MPQKARVRANPNWRLFAGTCIALLALASNPSVVASGQVTLAWDASPSPEVTGYFVLYGTASANYTLSTNVGNQTSAIIGDLSAGVTYFFVVTAYDASGNQSLPSNEVAYTPNSPTSPAMGNKAIVLIDGIPVSLNTASAPSTGAPLPVCASSFGKAVWFSFTPASSGLVTISTCGSDFDTVLQVYQGDWTSLVPVACNDDNGPACAGHQASVQFGGTGGTTYRILAGGWNSTSGNLSMQASVNTSWALTVTSSNPSSGVGISVSPADVGGLSGGQTPLVCSYNGNTVVTVTASAVAAGNTFLKWQCDGVDCGNGLSTTVTMNAAHTLTAVYQPPANPDLCSGAVALINGSPVSVNTAGATSTGDPVPVCVSSLGKGVWFSFTPASSGLVTISTCGSDFDTALQVYQGDCTSLVPVACDDDNGPACAGHQASVQFGGVGGTTYRILAGGWNSASGNLSMVASVNPSWALTVTSSNPSSGVGISVSPVDLGGQSGGQTPLVCSYNGNTVVTVTASAVAGGNTFLKWQCDGVDCGNGLSTTVTMTAAHTLTAVYQPPANPDLCNGAVALINGSPVSVNTAGATSTGDPVPVCASSFGKGVWFSFTPASSGLVTVSTCGSDFDTALQVYQGACTSLVPVACNDDNGPACAGHQASVQFGGTGGTTYRILAGGWNSASGNLSMLASVNPSWALTVTSSNPSSGVGISVSPVDLGGQSGGQTPLVCSYNGNTVVTATAPAMAAGNTFLKWQCDGVDWGNGLSTTVTMNAAHTLTAVFQPSGVSGYVTGVVPGSARNDFSGYMGMQIAVGSDPLTVTALGRMMTSGNSGTHSLKLVNAVDGTDVAGGSVSVAMGGGTVGQFQYGALANPVTLSAGASYYLVSQEATGGDSWLSYDTIVTTTLVATESGAIWGNGPGQWFFLGGMNRAFVPLDFVSVNRPASDTGTTKFVTGLALGTPRNDVSGYVGMEIVVGANPITVMALGRMMAVGNSGTHTVKIVLASHGSDVPGGSVTVSMSGGTVGQFQYASLSTPVSLAPGATYYVVTLESAGGDVWYGGDTRLTTTSAAAEVGPTSGTGPGTWSAQGLPNQTYGPVDFEYK